MTIAKKDRLFVDKNKGKGVFRETILIQEKRQAKRTAPGRSTSKSYHKKAEKRP